MAPIAFPKPLQQLLDDSPLYAPLRALADRVGTIVTDNKLPFFPDYTDHGIDHIRSVLDSEVQLIPKAVWASSTPLSDPRLLSDADAAVIIGGTLLHDIAMHLTVPGFRELIKSSSRYRPLPWFDSPHQGHSGDRRWCDLWDEYAREAQRFSERQLTSILGDSSARSWQFDCLPEDGGQWQRNHFLIVGEFIRRHHARLAHEIAIYGFPGLPVGSNVGQFPAMGKEEGHPLGLLADLIGVSARSHGTSLRVCQSYLELSDSYGRTPRPMGTAALYPMALLRVADYLQIDQQRAPAVLLQLRSPQSPVSVREWQKHRAVQAITPASDPRAKMITISPAIGFQIYLQLRDLLLACQAEIDHATAVLDEAYGTLTQLGLDQLQLAVRRVHSNLFSPAFQDNLPYVPSETGFTADPRLLTLLVEPLYGNNPGVGIRELVQNAADAARELHVWCTSRQIQMESLDLPRQEADVIVDIIKRDDTHEWTVRISDRGIGMTGDTIQEYFLRAGASFRHSPSWAREFTDQMGRPKVVRAGRFGVGAFAVFLLGPSFRMWTRHVTSPDGAGFELAASENSRLIEIRRRGDVHIGTTIEVDISRSVADDLGLASALEHVIFHPNATTGIIRPLLMKQLDWYCWDWPTVVTRVLKGDEVFVVEPQFRAPLGGDVLAPEWQKIVTPSFESVYWTVSRNAAPALSCNGLNIRDLRGTPGAGDPAYEWPNSTHLEPPYIAIVDTMAMLPLTINRYALSDRNLPFCAELVRDVTLSFIAHALVCGPTSRTSIATTYHHPLSKGGPDPSYRHEPDAGLTWCATETAFAPTDPWLLSTLRANALLAIGAMDVALDDGDLSERRLVGPHETLLDDGLSQVGIMEQSFDSDFQFPDGEWDDDEAATSSVKEFARSFVEHVMGLEDLFSAGSGHVEIVAMTRARRSADRDQSEGSSPKERFTIRPHGRMSKGSWTVVTGAKREADSSREYWTIFSRGSTRPRLPLDKVLKTYTPRETWQIVFAVELRIDPKESEPRSVCARIWNECLGPTAVPFCDRKRAELIRKGYLHPELRRHIDAWRQMCGR